VARKNFDAFLQVKKTVKIPAMLAQARDFGPRREAVLKGRYRSRHSGGFITEGEVPMSKPTHIAYVVIPPKEGSDKKAVWRKVGAVWPHTKGSGFDLVIDDQLSVSGRIVITERKDDEAEAAAPAA
jgi:hypothetical protein